MNINQVRQNLSASGIYPSFLAWWNGFWGINGIAIQYFSLLNQTEGSMPNTTQSQINFSDFAMSTIVNGTLIQSVSIPPQLQAIVDFVLQVV